MSKSKQKPTIEEKAKLLLEEEPGRGGLRGDKLDEHIKKLMQFFDEFGIDYSKYEHKFQSPLDAKAYPNVDDYMFIPGQRDTDKWKMALKNIAYKQKAGLPYSEAIRNSTQGWNKMEIFDFLNWLKFKEEGADMKYKFAQVWYENGQPGYFLHIKPDENKAAPQIDESAAQEERLRKEEKKQIIEKQRQKIIGRLDSAEKLLRAPEGQEFAGSELENLMEAIYNLKKKVQLVNKLSVSTRLYEDMIVREANILSRKGFVKAAATLYSLADAPSNAPPSATPPADPSGAGNPGAPGGLPAEAPGTPSANTPVGGDQQPMGVLPPPVPEETLQPKGLTEFIGNMNEGNKTTDSGEVDDELEVQDQEDLLMVSEAQTVPGPGIPPAALEDVPITDTPRPERGTPANIKTPVLETKTKPAKMDAPLEEPLDEPLEVTEEDIPVAKDVEPPVTSGFENKMDALLANVTIGDIVAELEDLSKVFKVREIPRRLAIVDMMLDGKGIASYFPQLSEAQNKALESNNYISTRVEEILSKLRGAMATKDIDLNGPETPVSPEVSGIKNKLEQDDAKEKQRKQMRKEQQEMELETPKKETPAVEINEDLAAPVPAPPVAPVPPAPKPLV